MKVSPRLSRREIARLETAAKDRLKPDCEEKALWCVCRRKFDMNRLLGEKEEHRWLVVTAPGMPERYPAIADDELQQAALHRAIESERAWQQEPFADTTAGIIDALTDEKAEALLRGSGVRTLLITTESAAAQLAVDRYTNLVCDAVRVLSDPEGLYWKQLGLSPFVFQSRLCLPSTAAAFVSGTLHKVWTDFVQPKNVVEEVVRFFNERPDT